MNLIRCILTNSMWYKQTRHNSAPVGVLWHDTGAGNPNVKRYVQPMESDENYDEMIRILGKNKNANDWNHTQVQKGVNAMIGKLADGSIGTVQTGDWRMAPWGCYHGTNGSCNGYIKVAGQTVYQGKHWLQIEICDDGYKDKAYFEKVYKEACEFTAYICEMFKINPYGTVEFNGVTVPTILCHQDAYQLKLGSNHGDVYKWFGAMGVAQDMDKVRSDVAALMGIEKKEEPVSAFKIGDEVKIKPDVETYYNGTAIPSWVRQSKLYVRDFKTEHRVVISTQKTGDITGTVYEKDLELVESEKQTATQVKDKPPFKHTPITVDSTSKWQPTINKEPKNDATSQNGDSFGTLLRGILDIILKILKK